MQKNWLCDKELFEIDRQKWEAEKKALKAQITESNLQLIKMKTQLEVKEHINKTYKELTSKISDEEPEFSD